MFDFDEPLEQWVAASFGAPVGLVPLLPQIFADLEEFGPRAVEVLRILDTTDWPTEPRVIDLGCGRGAAALAIVDHLRGSVLGVDGLVDFVDHAEKRADALGLQDRARFVDGDLRAVVRDLVEGGERFDLVCMLDVGNILGVLLDTVRILFRLLRPGGCILLSDAYLPYMDSELPDDLYCISYEASLDQFMTVPAEILAELRIDEPVDRMYSVAEARIPDLSRAHPDLEKQMNRYLESLRAMRDGSPPINEPLVSGLWLLRPDCGH